MRQSAALQRPAPHHAPRTTGTDNGHPPPIFRREAKKFRRPGLSTLSPLLPLPATVYCQESGLHCFTPACTLAIAVKDCRSAWAGWAGTLASCFRLVSGRGNPLPGVEGLRGALKRDCGQVLLGAGAGGVQRGSGYASAFNCPMVRFNLVIHG